MMTRMTRAIRRRNQRGQTSAEYAGMVALIAALVLVLVAAAPGVGEAVRSRIVAAIDGIAPGDGSAGGGEVGGAPTGPGDPGDPASPGAPGNPAGPGGGGPGGGPAGAPGSGPAPTDPANPALDLTASQGDGGFIYDVLMPAFQGISGAIGYLQSQRDRASTIGRLLRTHPDRAIRSSAGRLLRPLGEATSYGRSPVFRAVSRALPVVGFGLGTVANLADGQSPFEAVSRSALITGGGVLGGMAATGLVCGAAAVATAGIGGLVCGGAVLGAGVVGGLVGDFAGDVLFSDTAKDFYSDVGDLAGDVWDGATDVAGDVGDTLTFWD